MTEEIIPDIYNSKSELLVDVKSGSNPQDFQLESTKSSEFEKKVDIDR